MADNMDQPKIITEEQVLEVLTWPLVNAAVEEAMKATTQTQDNEADPQAPTSYAVQPPRTITSTSDKSKVLLTMPCYVGNYELLLNQKNEKDDHHEKSDKASTKTQRNTLACKVVTSFRGNQDRQPALPNIMANILLFSEQTGELRCVMAATNITARRTAAASIVATKYLFMQRAGSVTEHGADGDGAVRVAIIGCGVKGRSHALGMCHSFAVKAIYLWNRTISRAYTLAEDLRKEMQAHSKMVEVHVASTAGEAVAEANIICVCTYSPDALVYLNMLRKSDVHINAIGAGEVHFGEVSADIYEKALIYTDSWASARIELKDLPGTIVAEVGQVIHMKSSAPPKGSLTVFQSLGMASEDATVAQAVFEAL